MFERYTEKARRVVFFARYEAQQLGAPAIEPEYLLLGLLREHPKAVSRFLVSRFLETDASEEWFRSRIEAQAPARGKFSTGVDLPLSNASKRVLLDGAEEAKRLGHKYIGTEHLLLGLLREEKCLAARLLVERGADLKRIRKELAEAAKQRPSEQEEPTFRPGFVRAVSRSGGLRPPQVSPLADSAGSASKTGFERNTEGARRAIFFARYEAAQLGSLYIESEHLLLGLLREGKPHLDLFFSSGVTPDSVRA